MHLIKQANRHIEYDIQNKTHTIWDTELDTHYYTPIFGNM